ncbi:MAG: methylmalonyl-CoA decarboxylase subunit alpha [Actinomycetota bacterium]|jgi:acetyl-CoA carboxylase carboxyltransferase component|nr:methylmalonyl-CoA decarboxylase subunit alpha [Actinomycetota bacterium]
MADDAEVPAAPAAITYTYEGPSMQEAAKALAEKKAKYREMGGEERVARQHGDNKLTVRERLDLLFDEGSFTELSLLAHHQSQSPQMQGKNTPADGVVTGVGKVNGRRAAVIAYDFTVMAGSMGMVTEIKATRMRELALRERIPLVWLIDSAGARIQEAAGSMFARTGDLFREQVIMSGVVPQVAAMMGPGAAGTAYIPGLADFVPMVKGNSNMALAGPHLVKAAVGEDVTAEDMGGSKIHCKISGVADLEVADDPACIEAVRAYLSYFPSSNTDDLPIAETDDPSDRRCEELYDIVPANPRQAYDVHKVIKSISDDGEFFPMKPDWAKNIVTGFARFAGRPVGIVANQPKFLGGALDVNGADKAARFVWLCDAFSIPLVFLMDCPGFIVGSAVEKQGIIRHGAKMLFAVAEATVPKITVVLRKGYGAGYYVMNGRAYEPDLIVAWPTAEIAVMGPEGAVNIIFRKQIEAMPEDQQEEARNNMVSMIREQIKPEIAAGWAFVDDLIDPADTRSTIIRGLEASASKVMDRPWRKHGVLPV